MWRINCFAVEIYFRGGSPQGFLAAADFSQIELPHNFIEITFLFIPFYILTASPELGLSR
jgi:hypothetical protein